ncbi:hypothetical protein GJAV_G00047800 [Gymnothorax javanicus]|nr:hypothetical protein GJAV_G00047800 [Gymnothorax javanicus]
MGGRIRRGTILLIFQENPEGLSLKGLSDLGGGTERTAERSSWKAVIETRGASGSGEDPLCFATPGPCRNTEIHTEEGEGAVYLRKGFDTCPPAPLTSRLWWFFCPLQAFLVGLCGYAVGGFGWSWERTDTCGRGGWEAGFQYGGPSKVRVLGLLT